MSLLDNIIEASHEDVRQIVMNGAENVEETFKYNYAIRVRCKVACDGRYGKGTVKKGNEICQYIEDVFAGDMEFRLLKTRSTTMINHVTAATFVITAIIGFNGRPHINAIMKMMLKLSMCTLHFKPEDGFSFKITNLAGNNEKNRISANKLFNADTYRFLMYIFDTVPRRNTIVPRSVRRPYYVIQKYYDKNQINDRSEHYIPYIPAENESF